LQKKQLKILQQVQAYFLKRNKTVFHSMNLTLICTGEYPDQHAAAIRHSTLAKGLVEQGHTVTVLVLTPQEWNGKESINYFGAEYKCLNFYKGESKFLIAFSELKATLKAKKILQQQSAAKKLDAVVIFTIDVLPIYFLLNSLHKMGVKVFHERTELPYAVASQSARKQRKLKYYLDKLLPKFDGVFVISNKLVQYIGQYNKATKKLVTLVDLSFFKTEKKSPYPFPYIGYCGTISGNKDGVPILIEAFASITNKFPGLKLVLVGNNANKAAIKETLDAIEKYQLQDKVIFTGRIERDMMPVILCNAEILVVSKPDNEQNSGNFPIKIGEYLATGVPVVVTSVGEIPLFIKDGESGYLATPGSASSFAKKMEDALSNKEKATAAGLNGRRIAEENFDYRKVSKAMADYIEETVKSK
jgi:glycosyltransferase involved in cell wall biosynthesis